MDNLKIKVEHLQKLGKITEILDSYTCEAIADNVKDQNLQVSYSLFEIDGEILLKGNLKGRITLECCRCLDSFAYPIDLGINQAYPCSCEEIDLGNELKQLLVLNMPDKPLCRSNCAGLCPKCGKNLNTGSCDCSFEHIDPRWEKLKDIIKNK